MYPTWGGTVKFGGASADYRIMQSKLAPTQVMISRGTLQLDGYPTVDDKTPADPFAQIMIRETGTLSFGENINDFTNFFDLLITEHISDYSRSSIIPLRYFNSASPACSMYNLSIPYIHSDMIYSSLTV